MEWSQYQRVESVYSASADYFPSTEADEAERLRAYAKTLFNQPATELWFRFHWPIAPLLTVPLLVLPLLDAPFSEFDRGESEVANDTTTSPYLNQGEATSILAIGSAASLSLVIDTDFDVNLEDIGNIEDEQQQAIEEDGDEEDGKITQEIVEEGSEKSIPLNISVENHKRSLISSPIIEQRSDCLSPLYQRSCQRTTWAT